MKPERQVILEEAISLTVGDRNMAYGSPLINLTNVANLWNAYLNNKRYGTERFISISEDGYNINAHEDIHAVFDAVDVSNMMALMKMARMQGNPTHRDSAVDLAAYGSISGEIAIELFGEKQ